MNNQTVRTLANITKEYLSQKRFGNSYNCANDYCYNYNNLSTLNNYFKHMNNPLNYFEPLRSSLPNSEAIQCPHQLYYITYSSITTEENQKYSNGEVSTERLAELLGVNFFVLHDSLRKGCSLFKVIEE